MLKFLFKNLFSQQLMLVLIILFCIGMATGTFIENDFGTPAARALVYDALWFELIIALLGINFLGNIKKYRLWKKESWPSLIFHVAFVVIIIGAGISRLIAFEGSVHIREGGISNDLISDELYVKAIFNDSIEVKEQVNPTPVTSNDFSFNVNDQINVEFLSYIPHAKTIFEPASDSVHTGLQVLHLVTSQGVNGRQDLFVKSGQVLNLNGVLLTFNNPLDGDVNIKQNESGAFTITPSHDMIFMRMSEQSRDVVYKDSLNVFGQNQLYIFDNLSFVFKDFYHNGIEKIVSAEENKDDFNLDVLVVRITEGEGIVDVPLWGNKGVVDNTESVQLKTGVLNISFGSILKKLPFDIKLNDFVLERYPGSESPAAFSSYVEVIDEEKAFPFHIFMNNVLDYKGYRFFQASYDNDEKGTVLSVNHDFTGTLITYIGYGLMILGMCLIPFWKGSRMNNLMSQISGKATLITILLSVLTFGFSLADSTQVKSPISPQHIEKFSSMLIQDEGGRVKPLNTFSSEFLRKVRHDNSFENHSPDEVLFNLMVHPEVWSEKALIKIGNSKVNLKHYLNVDSEYASYVDFFDETGNYLLADATENAVNKKAAEQTEEDKLLMEVSQAVTLIYEVFSGNHFRFFPIPNDENNKWVSYNTLGKGFDREDSVFVVEIVPYYIKVAKKATLTGDWSEADELLSFIEVFQQKFGQAVIPSQLKIDMELAYNKSDIFNLLFKFYSLFGLILLALSVWAIVKGRKFKRTTAVLSWSIVLLFIIHTSGLLIRWYISGHAPWSNAYESMLYVAWSTVGMGMFFRKNNPLTWAATAFMASIFLMVAHWNWMNPEIGNLVPVLNSYWLMIHVAVIVASYGPFTVNFILGVLIMFFFIARTRKNGERLTHSIERLNKINEIIMTTGVFLLAIGTFLGGIWANESWGRYWSWDPKETWALISTLIYAMILHFRFIPGLKGNYAFSVASIFSYASIMMTYFGVNYFLAGMHSYAKGDPIPIPSFVWISIFLLFILVVLAFIFRKRYRLESSDRPDGR